MRNGFHDVETDIGQIHTDLPDGEISEGIYLRHALQPRKVHTGSKPRDL
jgi:hypothetical protein